MPCNYDRLSEAFLRTDFVIFDNDGVNYPITSEIVEEYAEAVARAGQEFIPGLSFNEAKGLAWESWSTHHQATYLFVAKYGADPEKIGKLYHKLCDEGIIPVDKKLAERFKAFRFPHAMLTHGTRDWVDRVLAHLGIEGCFDDKQIYTIEDVKFRKKDESSRPFQQVLYREGYQARRTMVVEDTPQNLIHAKEIGMMTVLVKNGRDFDPPKYPWVDFMVESLEDFLIVSENAPKPFRPAGRLVRSQRSAPVAPVAG
ncbi:MAG: HAD hydrolase-like protein [Alphaproteobacteria bacterium]|nr:HAD hydrolase-like protein [Alphaproteobacteria bacterium]